VFERNFQGFIGCKGSNALVDNQKVPYDLRLLHLTVKLPNRKVVQAEGKVAHLQLEEDQLGIGIKFYRIGDEDRKELNCFLESTG